MTHGVRRGLILAAGGVLLCLSASAQAAPKLRRLSSMEEFEVPRHCRTGAKLKAVLQAHFEFLAPHLHKVVRECAPARKLKRIRDGDSPYLVVAPTHPGPHFVTHETFDRLVFAAAFAHSKGGYRLAVGIGRRTLREQATLWNWRLVERFAALLKSGRKGTPRELARSARPSGEVMNPARFQCGSPHLTGDAVDVMLLDPDGDPLVSFKRRFMYGSKKAYRKKFLVSESEDAEHARLLEEVMYSAGFVRYCREAWHFETGRSPLYKFWAAAGKPGRCFGAGRGGTWDPRREPDVGTTGDMLSRLPRPDES